MRSWPFFLLKRRDVDENRAVVVYFVVLLSLAPNLAGWGTGLAQASVEFFLKNGLRLTAYQAATFGVLIAIPAYFGFAFGFLRDRWSPFGMGDRGYYLLFMPLMAMGLLAFAFGELTYARLAIGGLFVILCGRFVSTAMVGAMATVGQRRHLTGRLSSVVPLAGSLVRVPTLATGGWIAAHVAFPTLMVGLAIATLALVPLGFWRPKGVFETRKATEVQKPDGWREIARLLGHRPLWPMLGIQLLGSVALADVTAFFYHFTDRLHATP